MPPKVKPFVNRFAASVQILHILKSHIESLFSRHFATLYLTSRLC